MGRPAVPGRYTFHGLTPDALNRILDAGRREVRRGPRPDLGSIGVSLRLRLSEEDLRAAIRPDVRRHRVQGRRVLPSLLRLALQLLPTLVARICHAVRERDVATGRGDLHAPRLTLLEGRSASTQVHRPFTGESPGRSRSLGPASLGWSCLRHACIRPSQGLTRRAELHPKLVRHVLGSIGIAYENLAEARGPGRGRYVVVQETNGSYDVARAIEPHGGAGGPERIALCARDLKHG